MLSIADVLEILCWFLKIIWRIQNHYFGNLEENAIDCPPCISVKNLNFKAQIKAKRQISERLCGNVCVRQI